MGKFINALILVLGVLISGCTSQDSGQIAEPEYKPSEQFNVGNNVYVRSLKYDPSRNSLWVGTSVGVHQVSLQDNSLVNTFTREQGLANEYVFALGVDAENTVWFGTNAGGMSSYKNGEWKTYFPMHGLADYWIYAFANQGDTLWVGTWAGVNHLNLESGEIKTYVKELINEWVYGIDVDGQGRVWFGTEGGVSMFNGKDWVSWTHEDGLGAANVDGKPYSKNTGLGTRTRHDLGILSAGQPTYNPNYVFSILVDQKEHIWAGTWGGGVSVYAGDGWKNYTAKEGLAGNIVYSLAEDSKGNLWFGTDGGLSMFDGERFVNYTKDSGLLGNNVYSIEITNGDFVWAGTVNGVTLLKPSQSVN